MIKRDSHFRLILAKARMEVAIVKYSSFIAPITTIRSQTPLAQWNATELEEKGGNH
jgi:hypothetical protein